MPDYKRVTSTTINARQNAKSAEAINLLNGYASLRQQIASMSLIELLLDVLPPMIAELRGKHKPNPLT